MGVPSVKKVEVCIDDEDQVIISDKASGATLALVNFLRFGEERDIAGITIILGSSGLFQYQSPVIVYDSRLNKPVLVKDWLPAHFNRGGKDR